MLIIDKKPKSMAAESFRTLRTNIQYASVDEEYRVISVTSSEPAEGKTTISCNLAFAFAQGEESVLLIDCDLRKPSIHKKLKLSNEKGLSELLSRKKEISDVMQKYSENLVVISSGKTPPNPSEMLGSKAMKQLLEEVRDHFDYVILDTPPLGIVTDAQILSTKVDGSILVVRAGVTKKDTVKNSIDMIRKVNGNIIGTVLNGVEVPKNKYYNYYGDVE